MNLSETRLKKLICRQLKVNYESVTGFSARYRVWVCPQGCEKYAKGEVYLCWMGSFFSEDGRERFFVCGIADEKATFVPPEVWHMTGRAQEIRRFYMGEFYRVIIGYDGGQKLVPERNFSCRLVRRNARPRKDYRGAVGTAAIVAADGEVFWAWVYRCRKQRVEIFDIENSRWFLQKQVNRTETADAAVLTAQIETKSLL